MKKLAIINACTDLGVHINGTHLGPELLTKNLSNEKIENIYTLSKGNFEKELEQNNKQKNLEGVNEFNSRLYHLVCEILSKNDFPITLGGDHSLVMATALASISQNEKMGIIWFDAHGDYNTFDSTVSGNIHGLPLAAIDNYEKKYLTNFHNGNYYSPENTVVFGGRDIDPLEKENLKNAGVTVFSTEDIHREGIATLAKKAFEIASHGTNGVHISYDLDLIDPTIAPGVSIPAVNGITLEEAYELVDEIVKYKDIIKSADLVELNPLRDQNHVTEEIAKTILNKFIMGF